MDPSQPEFHDAQKLTVDVVGAWVRDDKDGWFKGDNDLIIATRHRVGTKPIIDKLHFMHQDVPEREWVGDFFHPIILAIDDFREEWAELTIQVRVYDQDGLDKEAAQEVHGAITGATVAASIAFPAFAPIAGLSSGAGIALFDLVNNLDDHDELIDAQIRLAVNKPEKRGWNHLQLVISFSSVMKSRPPDFILAATKDSTIRTRPGAWWPYDQYSYLVVRIQRGVIPSPDLIIDEKAATLLSEIENGKKHGGTEALHYLRRTLTEYANFKKLTRIVELQGKSSLTTEEQELLDSLRAEPGLQPFLPQLS